MKVDWMGLMEGVKNKLLPKRELENLIEQTYTERMAICHQCEFLRHNALGEKCGKCGCNLSLKGRCLSCQCPIDKWLAVISKEENETLKTTLNESDQS